MNRGGGKIKVTRKTSLAVDVLKIFFILLLFNFVVLSGTLYILTENLSNTLLIGSGISLLLSSVSVFFFKRKIEEILSKLLYVVINISENRNHLQEILIPFSIYEELVDIIQNIEETILEIENNYLSKIRDMESEYVPLVEKAGELIKSVEKLGNGFINPDEFPAGLDPVGAIGAALKESLGNFKEKIRQINELMEVLEGEIYELNALIEEKADYRLLSKKILYVRSILESIKSELDFFKYPERRKVNG